jgi:hypothetical protein
MKVTQKEIEATKEEIRCIEGQIEDLRGNIWSKMYDLVKKYVGNNVVTIDRYEVRCKPEIEIRTDPKGAFYPAEDFDDVVMETIFERLFGHMEE